MTDLVRRKDRHLAGNGGEFAEPDRGRNSPDLSCPEGGRHDWLPDNTLVDRVERAVFARRASVGMTHDECRVASQLALAEFMERRARRERPELFADRKVSVGADVDIEGGESALVESFVTRAIMQANGTHQGGKEMEAYRLKHQLLGHGVAFADGHRKPSQGQLDRIDAVNEAFRSATDAAGRELTNDEVHELVWLTLKRQGGHWSKIGREFDLARSDRGKLAKAQSLDAAGVDGSAGLLSRLATPDSTEEGHLPRAGTLEEVVSEATEFDEQKGRDVVRLTAAQKRRAEAAALSEVMRIQAEADGRSFRPCRSGQLPVPIVARADELMSQAIETHGSFRSVVRAVARQEADPRLVAAFVAPFDINTQEEMREGIAAATKALSAAPDEIASRMWFAALRHSAAKQ